jgi:hypothetical protein
MTCISECAFVFQPPSCIANVQFSVNFPCMFMCLQFGYAHMHCGSHGVYPEVCGWICAILQDLHWDFSPALDLSFINTMCIGTIIWSKNDSKEAMSPIAEDMIHSPNKLGTMGTRKILRARNAQQSIIYLSVLAAVFNYFCDFVAPAIEAEDPSVRDSGPMKCVRACRQLLSTVSLFCSIHAATILNMQAFTGADVCNCLITLCVCRPRLHCVCSLTGLPIEGTGSFLRNCHKS